MSTPTWFLPPDFTFRPDGHLQLGAVIERPRKRYPVKVLYSPTTEAAAQIQFPEVRSLIETNHQHSHEKGLSVGSQLFYHLLECVSASLSVDFSKRGILQYGPVDHEVRFFNHPLSEESLAAIINIPKVRNYIASGLYGKRSVYIVTGQRVTLSSFTVMNEMASSTSTEASASAPVTAIPMNVGAGASTAVEETRGSSYETAPGIIFAYRLSVIRNKRSDSWEETPFAHSSAFMTGETEQGDNVIEIAEVTQEILDQDDDSYEGPTKDLTLEDGEHCIWYK